MSLVLLGFWPNMPVRPFFRPRLSRRSLRDPCAPVPGIHKPLGVRYSLSRDWVQVMAALTKTLGARVILGINLDGVLELLFGFRHAVARLVEAAKGELGIDLFGADLSGLLEVDRLPKLIC